MGGEAGKVMGDRNKGVAFRITHTGYWLSEKRPNPGNPDTDWEGQDLSIPSRH